MAVLRVVRSGRTDGRMEMYICKKTKKTKNLNRSPAMVAPFTRTWVIPPLFGRYMCRD